MWWWKGSQHCRLHLLAPALERGTLHGAVAVLVLQPTTSHPQTVIGLMERLWTLSLFALIARAQTVPSSGPVPPLQVRFRCPEPFFTMLGDVDKLTSYYMTFVYYSGYV